MLKRTRGYVVLTLLILTGLASQVYSPTITSTERRLVISKLKESRKSFSTAVEGLSQKQLNYKAGNLASIKTYCAALEAYQKEIWLLTQTAMETPQTFEGSFGSGSCQPSRTCEVKSPCRSVCSKRTKGRSETLTGCIRDSQTELIRYAKTTTEDLHSYVLHTSKGKMDIYQALISVSQKTAETVALIQKVKTSPGFPKS